MLSWTYALKTYKSKTFWLCISTDFLGLSLGHGGVGEGSSGLNSSCQPRKGWVQDILVGVEGTICSHYLIHSQFWGSKVNPPVEKRLWGILKPTLLGHSAKSCIMTSMLPIVPNTTDADHGGKASYPSYLKETDKNFPKFDSTQNAHITNKLEVERNLPNDKQWKINKAKN